MKENQEKIILSPKVTTTTPRIKHNNHHFSTSFRSLRGITSDEIAEDIEGEAEDPLGEEMTRILNQNSYFKFNAQTFVNDNNNDPSSSSSSSLKPLLSKENWYFVNAFLVEAMDEPKAKIQSTMLDLRNFLFWNTKSLGTFTGLFFGLAAMAYNGA